MRLGRLRRWRAPWWAWLVLLPTLTLLTGLGLWQLQRASDKEQMLAQRQAAGKGEGAELAAAGQPERLYGRRVRAAGRYLDGRQILLDNQVWQGRAGYRVWTPLQLDDGRLVLVDRGWVPLGRNRAQTPQPEVPAGAQQVAGLWREWPEPGMRLEADDVCAQRPWPRVLNYPPYEHVACQYAAPVIDGLVLLDEDAAGGFPRDWDDVGLPPARHIGYAVQWFAMALAVVVIFVVVNVRRKQDDGR